MKDTIAIVHCVLLASILVMLAVLCVELRATRLAVQDTGKEVQGLKQSIKSSFGHFLADGDR